MTRPMTMTEKILAAHAGRDHVAPGEIAVVDVDTVVPIDLNFYDGAWFEPVRVFDPDRIVFILDHIIPATGQQSAEALERAREFAGRMGITRVHDVGGDQGICHQLISDVPYARPGEMLVCVDSHTCSAGALNCAARGIGIPELTYALVHGRTWFRVGETIRYVLTGALRPGVAPKDLFLTIAGRWGDHVGCNVEFGGPGLAGLSVDERRTLTTMCAEISAEFALCEPDDVLERHLVARGVGMDGAVEPDPGASYADERELDLGTVEPMVALPDTVVENCAAVSTLQGTRINRAFIGSCSNGTLQDLRDAARVLERAQVHPDVTLLVTPASQRVYRAALEEGLIATLSGAGALVTASSCGMCAGFENTLTAGDVCISSSTRNFKGRMGSPGAKIYLASSSTVAASAAAGEIRWEGA